MVNIKELKDQSAQLAEVFPFLSALTDDTFVDAMEDYLPRMVRQCNDCGQGDVDVDRPDRKFEIRDALRYAITQTYHAD